MGARPGLTVSPRQVCSQAAQVGLAQNKGLKGLLASSAWPVPKGAFLDIKPGGEGVASQDSQWVQHNLRFPVNLGLAREPLPPSSSTPNGPRSGLQPRRCPSNSCPLLCSLAGTHPRTHPPPHTQTHTLPQTFSQAGMDRASPLRAQGFDHRGEQPPVLGGDLGDVLGAPQIRIVHRLGQGGTAGAVTQRAREVAAIPRCHGNGGGGRTLGSAARQPVHDKLQTRDRERERERIRNEKGPCACRFVIRF